MKSGRLILSLTCAAMLFSFQVMAKSLVIPGPRSKLDISHDYHKTLLQMALAATDAEMPNIFQQPFVSESRVIAEIKKHKVLDVYWFGADTALDKDLRAIPIPTTKGLIGYRKFIILQKNRAQFDKVTDLSSLAKLTACQGTFWPDTKILKQARLKVTTAVGYEDLFKMLAAERCDYFPRGIHDHTKEVELRQQQYSNFSSYQDILLHYPFAVFFYVSYNAKALAEQLEAGMRALAQDNKIEQLMKTHALTSHIFPLAQSQEIKYISIPNPYINPELATEDKRYWLQPEYFGIKEQ